MSKALVLIDLQNDYFPGGKFPLWNTEKVLENIKQAIAKAKEQQVPIILVQHIADPAKGMAPFFNKGTEGAAIRSDILEMVPNAKIVVKTAADGFYETKLEEVLTELGATELLMGGMMTQNCVTHTAISKSAEKYDVKMLQNCCTTVNEMIHLIALNAVSTRIKLVDWKQVL